MLATATDQSWHSPRPGWARPCPDVQAGGPGGPWGSPAPGPAAWPGHAGPCPTRRAGGLQPRLSGAVLTWDDVSAQLQRPLGEPLVEAAVGPGHAVQAAVARVHPRE